MSLAHIYDEEIERQDLSQDPPEYEPQRQYYFIKKARQYLKAWEEREGRKLFMCTVNMGCQMITERKTEKSPYFWAFFISVCLCIYLRIWGS